MPDNISCPVSHIKVNENRVRIVAAFVFVTSLSYFLLPWWPAPALLAIDFFLRVVDLGRYSPFNVLSGWIVRALAIGDRPVDRAPKQFAAQLGFLFSTLLLTVAVFSLPQTGYIFAAILVLFSFLESALGFCAGCYVYTLIRKIFPAADTSRNI